MKNLKRFLVLFFMINLTLTGCYTIVWDPTEEISYTPGNNDESGFYENVHYGNFSDFYDTPWWISSPVFIGTYDGSGTKTKDRTNNNRNDETNSFRNDGGRGNNERNPGFNNGNSGTTINTPPPTRNVGSENTSETQNPNSTRNSNSSSDNGTRNSNSGNTKDNSSTRNSGNGRR
ncbi:MAG: hypothetical protein HND40_04120 [Ignavibacteriota bacterium]|jgi:hypothetical protein|nr:MAG: hypothetical protein F9K42_00645 [Ignavibacterium sp.]MBL1155984.1 hypothetical protein [Ignavibacteriota bacterium]MCO6447329.1 hypothetical protein [Ignavibacterium album]MCZ2269339.1 hypothetical protein [Ignavibacteriales bacterium]MDX9712757.1 hypothetical protein [Ignavibacteriaceae bacterium]